MRIVIEYELIEYSSGSSRPVCGWVDLLFRAAVVNLYYLQVLPEFLFSAGDHCPSRPSLSIMGRSEINVSWNPPQEPLGRSAHLL